MSAQLDQIVERVQRHAPLLAPYFEGESTLEDHIVGIRGPEPESLHGKRRALLTACIEPMLQRGLGKAGRALLSSDDLRCVNVVDHHQLLNHPLLLGSNVIAGGRSILAEDGRSIPVFSCANIGPGNDYMRRGFLFRGQNVPYFSAKEHRDAMYFLGPRRFDFVERQRRIGSWTDHPRAAKDFLQWYQDFLNGLDFSGCDSHRDQIVVAVRNTWPLLFSPDLRPQLPELLYVNAEEAFGRFLVKIFEEENYLRAAVFDATFRAAVLGQFDGIFGAWQREENRGTHFFWRKHPRGPKLLRMWVEGDRLVPAEASFEHLSVELQPERISTAIEEEELVPCVALWISATLFAGINPLVGPNSLIYTTQLKEAWNSLLRQVREPGEAELLTAVRTDQLIAGMPLFFSRQDESVFALAAADLIATGGASRDYLKTIFDIQFRDLLRVGAPGIHELFTAHSIPDGRLRAGIPALDRAAEAVHTWV